MFSIFTNIITVKHYIKALCTAYPEDSFADLLIKKLIDKQVHPVIVHDKYNITEVEYIQQFEDETIEYNQKFANLEEKHEKTNTILANLKAKQKKETNKKQKRTQQTESLKKWKRVRTKKITMKSKIEYVYI